MGSTLAVPIRKALEACLRHRLHGCLQRRWERRCGRCSPAEMIQIVHCQFTYSATSHGVAVVCCVCRYPLYNTPRHCIAARGVNSLQQVLRKVKKRQGIQCLIIKLPPQARAINAYRSEAFGPARRHPSRSKTSHTTAFHPVEGHPRATCSFIWPHNAHQKSAVHL